MAARRISLSVRTLPGVGLPRAAFGNPGGVRLGAGVSSMGGRKAGSAVAVPWLRRLVYPGNPPYSWWAVRVGGTVAVLSRNDDGGRRNPFEQLLDELGLQGAAEEELEQVRRVLARRVRPGSGAMQRAEAVLRRYFSQDAAPVMRKHVLAALAGAPAGETPFQEVARGLPPFEAARSLLVRELPFLAAAAYLLRPVETRAVATCAVDRRARCYLNPDWAAGLSVGELAGVLYHELCHLARLHFERGERVRAPAALWNVACDLEINDDFDWQGRLGLVVLPKEALRPGDLGLSGWGKLAEDYYRDLLSPENRARIPAARGIARGSCGSVAGGPGDPGEVLAGEGGVELPRGVSAAEVAAVAEQLAAAVEAQLRQPGLVPGSWARWVEQLRAARHDWRRELSALVVSGLRSCAGAVDYTFARPSRRWAVTAPVRLPALVRPRAEVAIVVDTSGSMSPRLLEQALAEVDGILAANGRCRVTVLAVDAAVQAVSRVTSAERVVLRGGGGTRMGVGIEAALKLRPRPDLVIVLTDGYTPWPEKNPGVPVVVGLLHPSAPDPPAWARAVRIKP